MLFLKTFILDLFYFAYLVVITIKGLMELTNGMDSPPSIVPFLPGHFEVFDLKQNGKVQSIQMEQFHSCTKEPAHAVYDTVTRLPTSMTYFSL